MVRESSSPPPCIRCPIFPFASACVGLAPKYFIALDIFSSEKTRMLKMYWEIVTFCDNVQVANHSLELIIV